MAEISQWDILVRVLVRLAALEDVQSVQWAQ